MHVPQSAARCVLVVSRARPRFATLVLDAAHENQDPTTPARTIARLQRPSAHYKDACSAWCPMAVLPK